MEVVPAAPLEVMAVAPLEMMAVAHLEVMAAAPLEVMAMAPLEVMAMASLYLPPHLALRPHAGRPADCLPPLGYQLLQGGQPLLQALARHRAAGQDHPGRVPPQVLQPQPLLQLGQ